MLLRFLKPVRLGIAVLVLLLFAAAFADFRGLLPLQRLAHLLARGQFGPSLVALATGSLVLGAGCLAVILLTLGAGRVYCSTLCPLGLLQDAVARVAGWIAPRRRSLPFRPAHDWLRHGVLGLAALAAALGAGSAVTTWLDPYSHFGRFVSGLFRPLLATLNNLLVAPAERLGFPGFYRVEVSWPATGLLALLLTLFLLLVAIAAARGRLFCNSVCPVGTLLGLVSRTAALRLVVDRAACSKCAACLGACKAQCLDLRRGSIDASRCVGCFNCVTACPRHGIRLSFAWRRAAFTADPGDPGRRALLAGAAALATAPLLAATAPTASRPASAARAPVIPPGGNSTADFLARCTACQLCVSSCLTGVLQPAALEHGFTGLMKPRLDFHRAFCNYDCNRCGDVCPTGAIAPLALADKQLTSLGVARFHEDRCIVSAEGTDCAACSEHCPTKAVDTVPFRDNLRLPRVDEALCIGCGACEYACPVRPERAILVESRPVHARAARPPVEKPAERPRAADFPF